MSIASVGPSVDVYPIGRVCPSVERLCPVWCVIGINNIQLLLLKRADEIFMVEICPDNLFKW